MTQPRLPAAALPDWPRLLSADLAAAYLGVAPGTLAGLGLQRVAVGRRVLYDRRDLDAFADRLAGDDNRGAHCRRCRNDWIRRGRRS